MGGNKIELVIYWSFLLLLIIAPTSFAQLQEAPSDSVEVVASRDLFDVLNRVLRGQRLKPEYQGELQPGLTWIGYPSFSYNPVYGFAYGISAAGAGRLGNPAISRISNLAISANYSTTEQVQLQLKGDLFLAQNKLLLKLDTRYLDTSRSTYGLGAHTFDAEEYPMSFKMTRGYLTGLWQIGTGIYAGVGYHLDTFRDIVDDRAVTGEMTPYLEYTGSSATESISSGFSINLLADGRDNPVNPRAGYYISTSFRSYQIPLESDVDWQEMFSEFRAYPLIPANSRNRLAFWLYTWFTFGDVPYLGLPHVGGDTYGRSGRGYLQGEIRGRNMTYLELEYRMEITRDGLLGAVVFANLTTMTDNDSGRFDKADYGAGAGLRVKFSKKSDSNLTIDFAWGEDREMGVWLGTSEVF
jgi:outer membrane protein assembly factor BamA